LGLDCEDLSAKRNLAENQEFEKPPIRGAFCRAPAQYLFSNLTWGKKEAGVCGSADLDWGAMRLRGPKVGQGEHDSPGVPSSRRAVLGAAALAGIVGGLPFVRGLFRLGDALGSPSKAQDVKILQLVLQVEYTQVAFYEQALDHAGLDGELRSFAEAALAHEREHLAAIRNALGTNAGPKPTFDFGSSIESAEAFRQAAIDLEDTAVAGYNGQATNLTKATLAAAATIVSVEARHAAWVRAIAGEVAAPDPVDTPMTAQQVAQSLREIGLTP